MGPRLIALVNPDIEIGLQLVDETIHLFAERGTNPTSFTYQWSRAGAAISGATGSSYVPVTADIGNTLTVSVTAANTGGSSPPATSAATGAVINIIPANSTVPTIFGTAQVGQTLTATTGTWTNNPTSFTYQWNRAGAAISGATASSYVPVTADIGNTLTVSVTAANTGGSSPRVTSAPTGAVINIIPANSTVPTISGTAQVGQMISGATSSTYTLQGSDQGDLISVYSNGVFSALVGPVIGTTVFYVSSSEGSDSNPGTTSQPWKTLAHVNGQTFSPGTSILFKRGDGIVTSLKEEHENSASRIFSNYRDCLAPHVHSRRAKGSVRPCRSKMTLDVESVVGGCVS
jgi:hypothetical protein